MTIRVFDQAGGPPAGPQAVRLRSGEPSVAELHGEIDAACAEEVGRYLHATLGAHPSVTLDLRPLAFIDCAGARRLVQFHRARAAAGHTTQVVVRAGSAVERFFSLAGLLGVLDIHRAATVATPGAVARPLPPAA